MQETLSDHKTSISIGGRPLWNLRFADDIDILAGSSKELQELTDKLADRSGTHLMEISSEKGKILVNTLVASMANIMNQQKLKEIRNFKYLANGTYEAEI